MKQSTKKLLALLTAGMLCAGSLGALPAFAETEGESGENDTIDTAEAIDVNTEVTGNLSSEDDVDCYKVTLEQDGALALDFINENVNAYAYYWNISLLYEDGSKITSWDFYGTNKKASYTPVGLNAGTYYIEISKSNSYSEKDYTFKANFLTSSDTLTYESENNDTIDKADAIPTNMNICGNLHDEDDVDYYAIELTEPGAIGIDFINENVNAYAYYWNISLLYEDGSKITSWDYYGTNKKYSYTPIGLKAGIYYIKICKSDSHSEKSYAFKANLSLGNDTLIYESENNNSISNADEIPFNTEIMGNLVTEEDEDFYKVTLEQNGTLTLDFTNNSVNAYGYFWKVSLLHEDGSEVTTWDVYGTNKKSTFTKTGLKNGIYYIRITKSNTHSDKSYSFSITKSSYTKGDANADGSIDSTDVFEMMYSCAKKAVGRTDDLLEGENFLAADIDENGTLDSTDIFYEMLYIASKGAGVPVDWDSIVK